MRYSSQITKPRFRNTLLSCLSSCCNPYHLKNYSAHPKADSYVQSAEQLSRPTDWVSADYNGSTGNELTPWHLNLGALVREPALQFREPKYIGQTYTRWKQLLGEWSFKKPYSNKDSHEKTRVCIVRKPTTQVEFLNYVPYKFQPA